MGLMAVQLIKCGLEKQELNNQLNESAFNRQAGAADCRRASLTSS
jgi:hypothetical protein